MFLFFLLFSLFFCLCMFNSMKVFLLMMGLFVILVSYKVSYSNSLVYIISFLLYTSFVLSNHALSWFVFFEMSFLPMAYLILVESNYYYKWKAIMYFLFYTVLSAFPLFVLMYFLSDLSSLVFVFNYSEHQWYYVLFLLPFFFKLPVFIFHSWLPKAHVMAPIGVSMVLASILLKVSMWSMFIICHNMGNYIFVVMFFLLMMSSFSLFSLFKQMDTKVFVAYSSVFHMSLLASGLCLQDFLTWKSSLAISLLHSFISPLMFYVVYLCYLSTGSRFFIHNISKSMFLIVMMFIVIMNLNLPPLPGFFFEVGLFGSMLSKLSLFMCVFFAVVFLISMVCYFFFFMYLQSNKYSYNSKVKFNFGNIAFLVLLSFYCYLIV